MRDCDLKQAGNQQQGAWPVSLCSRHFCLQSSLPWGKWHIPRSATTSTSLPWNCLVGIKVAVCFTLTSVLIWGQKTTSVKMEIITLRSWKYSLNRRHKKSTLSLQPAHFCRPKICFSMCYQFGSITFRKYTGNQGSFRHQMVPVSS